MSLAGLIVHVWAVQNSTWVNLVSPDINYPQTLNERLIFFSIEPIAPITHSDQYQEYIYIFNFRQALSRTNSTNFADTTVNCHDDCRDHHIPNHIVDLRNIIHNYVAN